MKTEGVKNRVYTLRTEKHITQEELAHSIGVSRQTIIAIEKHQYVPSIMLALKLARYFKKPVDDIFMLRKQ